MNVAEIEDSIAQLADKPFSPDDFFLGFMEAYAAPPVTVTKMRKGDSPKSDVDGAWLWRNKVHAAACPVGLTDVTLQQLQASKKTKSGKVRYVMAFDGRDLSALDLKTEEPLFCPLAELPDNFAFFLPLAGYERYRAAEENPVDIRATARLAKLYDALLRRNPNWVDAERRHDMNTFMTRVIFCLFAEDTGIFPDNVFTKTIHDLGGKDGNNVASVLSTAFEVMNLAPHERDGKPAWAAAFPYVNGGLFDDPHEAPDFDKTAFNYLIQAGRLDWKEINPDIFGSMIQAIVDHDSRGGLGMHYTSVPNILKVLDPLFLDNLRVELDKSKGSEKRLNKFLARLERIRVFDPACGSGNFLVIAYRELRTLEIEALRYLRQVTGFPHTLFSRISLNNFYGIEYADFAAETAKLSLWVAEYQMNKRFEAVLGKRPPDLPLRESGHIVCNNALRLEWQDVCPPAESKDVETYVVGNPPYGGTEDRTREQRDDMQIVFRGTGKKLGYLDYVGCWFWKGASYLRSTGAPVAFVATNSICQGSQVPTLWPEILDDLEIGFAHLSFKWSNNAAKNAGVSCVIVSLRLPSSQAKHLIEADSKKKVRNINAYLAEGENIYVEQRSRPISRLNRMVWGNKATDDGNLILLPEEKDALLKECPEASRYVRRFYGSQEFIKGIERYCLWIADDEVEKAKQLTAIKRRIDAVAEFRMASKADETRPAAAFPHRFRQIQGVAREHSIIIPKVSSERRPYLPVGLLTDGSIVSDNAFAIYDAPEWTIALIASRLHLVWIAAVCGKLENRYRYSNTLGWHTFPVPKLSDQDMVDLTETVECILEVREAHFPKTIAELYDPVKMPQDLREAHRANDEVVEKIFAGRAFRNDTERLEELFKRYAKMIAQEEKAKVGDDTKRVTRKKEVAIG